MTERVLITIILILLCFQVKASKVDSLIHALESVNTKEKLPLLLDISNEYLSSSPQRSLFYVEQAIIMALENANLKYLSRAYRIKGVAHYLHGDYENAGVFYYKSLAIAEKINLKSEIGATLVNLGNLNNARSKLEVAEKFYNDALKIYSGSKNYRGIAKIENNLGLICYQRKQTKEAMMHYDKAILFNQKINDSIGIAHVYGNIAIAYEMMKNYSMAIQYCRKSVSISFRNHDDYGAIAALIGLGSIYIENNEPYKAQPAYEQALQIAKKGKYIMSLRECYKALFNLYANKNENNKTKEYLNLYLAYNDSIAKEESSKQLAEMQVKYESEKKNEQIEALNKDKKIQKLEISLQKNIRNLMILFSMLIIVALIIILKFYQKKKLSEKRLQELNNTKDKLFSIIAHDLRGPINSVLVITEYLANPDSNPDKDEIKKYSQKLNKTTENINLLLENLLHWAISQIGLLKLSITQINLYEIIPKTVQTLGSLADNKRIVIEYIIPQNSIVNCDVNLIRVILRNLISNAIKYSYEGGKVTILVEDNTEIWRVNIIDNGIGIKKENAYKLFKLDTMQTTIGTSKEKGTGLGLILCKEFVEKMGGTISVESEEGKGSKFIFTIKKY